MLVRVEWHISTVSNIHHILYSRNWELNKRVDGGEPLMRISIVNEATESLTVSAPDDTTE